MINQFSLKEQNKKLKSEIIQKIDSVITSSSFILGSNLKKFENNIAKYLDVKYAIGCNSGTDAIYMALIAAGVKRNDEVITTPFTYMATVEAIMFIGAKPILVDINKKTFNIDLAQLNNKINKNTKAIIPVHIFGNPIDVNEIKKIIGKKKIKIIEDCAQAFGAMVKNQKVGSLGDIGCFSFYPTKNLGCFGDGGMVVTNNKNYYKKIISLRNHGSLKRYIHTQLGFNSRLDEIQAAILNIKLKYINKLNNLRIKIAAIYSDELKKVDGIETPLIEKNKKHVFHQYTILANNRSKIIEALNSKGIQTSIFYKYPVHKQKVFYSKYKTKVLKNCDYVQKRCLSLPIYPELNEKDIYKICSIIKKVK